MYVKKLNKSSNNIKKFIFSIDIIAYNIHGLANKCLFPEFFEFVCSCDVFALFETHVEEGNTEKWRKYFSNFDLIWKPATRISTRGRAIAGCVYGVKKDLVKNGVRHDFVEINGTSVINLKIHDVKFSIIPV